MKGSLSFHIFQILPIGMVILSIVSFRFGRFAEMFDWTTNNGYQYLPSWVREIGAMMQVLPILMVPFVAVIQSCRYFLNSNGQERMHEVSREKRLCLKLYLNQFKWNLIFSVLTKMCFFNIAEGKQSIQTSI